MVDENSKKNGFISRLPGKLAILIGSGLTILNGAPKLDAKIPFPEATGVKSEVAASVTRPLPPKLILKHVGDGYKMIAQHDSHSSHASHSSHDSHSSHASHDSHSSHASHSSHTSGGFQ